MSQHVALVRLDPRRSDPSYVASVLAGEVGQVQIRRLNDGGAKARLNLPGIRRLVTPLPSLDEQRALAEPVEQVENRLEIEREAVRSLRQVMSVLLTGEVRVKSDEESV